MRTKTRWASAPIMVVLVPLVAGCGSDLRDHDTLIGTWDIIATANPSCPVTFVWSGDGGTVSYRKASSEDLTTAAVLMSGQDGTAKWSPSRSHLTIHRSGDPIDSGAIPFNIGGAWTLANNEDPARSCTAQLAADSFSIVCPDPSWLGALGIKWGGITARRTETASSIFGDLGGKWVIEHSGGGAECTAAFSAGNINVTCPPTDGGKTGSLAVTIAGDMVSGSTSTGVEFSGQRRQ